MWIEHLFTHEQLVSIFIIIKQEFDVEFLLKIQIEVDSIDIYEIKFKKQKHGLNLIILTSLTEQKENTECKKEALKRELFN